DSAARRLERASNEAKARVQPQIEAARSAFAAFFAVIKTRILDAQKMDITTAEVYTASGNVSTALKELSDVSYAAMTAAVEQRLHAVTIWRNLTAGITALAFALALSWLITRSMARPLAHAIAVFRKISAGKYDSEIRLTGTDEASQVLSALSEMQDKLRTQIQTERTAATENTRIRQALDKVSTSVVLADGHHKIIYLNDTAQAT